MKQCFSLHKMCELYHICCFIRQCHIEEKWAIYHPGEYIFVSGAGASAPRRRGHVRKRAGEHAAHAGNASGESFYGKMETLFVGRRKK